MTAPLVSIVVPVYNAEKYLTECLHSLVNQTMPDFEILLVDDGSTDASLATCWSYAEHDDRIKVFTQNNAGAAVARNRALDEATGKWVMFVDSDDYLEIDCIERLLNAADVSDVDIALGATVPSMMVRMASSSLSPIMLKSTWPRQRHFLRFFIKMVLTLRLGASYFSVHYLRE